MTHTLLDRYERAVDGRIIIDVTAERVEALYSNFDRSAPFIRRDLDQDLVDYLIDCAREIGNQPFLIRFSLTQAPDESHQGRIRGSIDSYFRYLIESEWMEIRQMFRRSAILFLIGLGILFVSVLVNRWMADSDSVVGMVFAEGLTVAAWVSLWEALAVFLIEWLPYRRTIRIYERLVSAPLQFRVSVDGPPESGQEANQGQAK